MSDEADERFRMPNLQQLGKRNNWLNGTPAFLSKENCLRR